MRDGGMERDGPATTSARTAWRRTPPRPRCATPPSTSPSTSRRTPRCWTWPARSRLCQTCRCVLQSVQWSRCSARDRACRPLSAVWLDQDAHLMGRQRMWSAVRRRRTSPPPSCLRPQVSRNGQRVLPLLSARDRMVALARDGSSGPSGAAAVPHIEEGGQ